MQVTVFTSLRFSAVKLSSHLSTLRHRDRDFWFVIRSDRCVLDLTDDEHPVDDAAEHDVLPVKEFALGRRDKELTAVRVLRKTQCNTMPS